MQLFGLPAVIDDDPINDKLDIQFMDWRCWVKRGLSLADKNALCKTLFGELVQKDSGIKSVAIQNCYNGPSYLGEDDLLILVEMPDGDYCLSCILSEKGLGGWVVERLKLYLKAQVDFIYKGYRICLKKGGD